MEFKNAFVFTDGNGFWSSHKCKVKILSMELTEADLRVYFSVIDWDVDKYGLIYTDEGWMKGFKALLRMTGFSAAATLEVCYSEQGMQGVNYVSLDVGKKFIQEFKKLSKTKVKSEVEPKKGIDFKNRTCRKDGRKKNYYSESLQGDFQLVMGDVDMGDYSELWEEFILSLKIPDVRAKFQSFLKKKVEE
jgi:hypothetical protein